MKKNSWIHGFTLAEILITLLILGFIAALTVPMLGLKKQKPTSNKGYHGTVECFYMPKTNQPNLTVPNAPSINLGSNVSYDWGEKEFELKHYEADNFKYKNGKPASELQTDSIACYFKAPVTGSFTIQAIGAGGDGAYDITSAGQVPTYAAVLNNYELYKDTSNHVMGYIPVGPAFLSSIESDQTPNWVREEWNKQWNSSSTPIIEYTVQSPLGYPGKDLCDVKRNDYIGEIYQEECIKLCSKGLMDATCPHQCKIYIKADGGASGRGASYTVPVQLKYSPKGEKDNVQYNITDSETTLSFADNKYITLYPSGAGGNAYNSGGTGVPGTSGVDFKIPTNLSSNNDNVVIKGLKAARAVLSGQQAGLVACQNQTQLRKKGSIVVNIPDAPESKVAVKYEAYQPAIRATFGEAGGAASMQLITIEGVKKGTEFKLIPAKDWKQTTEVYMKVVDANNPSSYEWKPILTGPSGAKGASYTNKLISMENGDFPFPTDYYPSKFTYRTPAVRITPSSGQGFASLLASKMTETTLQIKDLVSAGAVSSAGALSSAGAMSSAESVGVSSGSSNSQAAGTGPMRVGYDGKIPSGHRWLPGMEPPLFEEFDTSDMYQLIDVTVRVTGCVPGLGYVVGGTGDTGGGDNPPPPEENQNAEYHTQRGVYPFIPGAGGAGGYPLVGYLNMVAKHFINGYATYNEYISVGSEKEINVYPCYSVLEPSGAAYCKPTKGQPGAIVISW